MSNTNQLDASRLLEVANETDDGASQYSRHILIRQIQEEVAEIRCKIEQVDTRIRLLRSGHLEEIPVRQQSINVSSFINNGHVPNFQAVQKGLVARTYRRYRVMYFIALQGPVEPRSNFEPVSRYGTVVPILVSIKYFVWR